jgi:hypothetical protein
VGYDVHITRAEEWFDSEASPITLEEWVAYAEADPDLRRNPVNGEAFYDLHVGGDETWLDWFEGAILTKNPPKHVLAKMVQIADVFGANVQGDEGERYGLDGRVIPDENWDAEGRPRHRQRRGLLSRLFGSS